MTSIGMMTGRGIVRVVVVLLIFTSVGTTRDQGIYVRDVVALLVVVVVTFFYPDRILKFELISQIYIIR